MLGLKKKILLYFFLDRPPARIWVIWVQIFTIFHIEFAEKSQKIRTSNLTKKESVNVCLLHFDENCFEITIRFFSPVLSTNTV